MLVLGLTSDYTVPNPGYAQIPFVSYMSTFPGNGNVASYGSISGLTYDNTGLLSNSTSSNLILNMIVQSVVTTNVPLEYWINVGTGALVDQRYTTNYQYYAQSALTSNSTRQYLNINTTVNLSSSTTASVWVRNPNGGSAIMLGPANDWYGQVTPTTFTITN